MERGESTTAFARMRSQFEAEKSHLIKEYEQKLADCRKRYDDLQHELNTSKEHIVGLQQRDRGLTEEVSRAVATALREQRERDAAERRETISRIESESQRVRTDAADRMDTLKEQHRKLIEAQRESFEESKALLLSEKMRFEAECVRLRNELQEVVKQVLCGSIILVMEVFYFLLASFVNLYF
jgi:chromosome segregation ATPase